LNWKRGWLSVCQPDDCHLDASLQRLGLVRAVVSAIAAGLRIRFVLLSEKVVPPQQDFNLERRFRKSRSNKRRGGVHQFDLNEVLLLQGSIESLFFGIIVVILVPFLAVRILAVRVAWYWRIVFFFIVRVASFQGSGGFLGAAAFLAGGFLAVVVGSSAARFFDFSDGFRRRTRPCAALRSSSSAASSASRVWRPLFCLSGSDSRRFDFGFVASFGIALLEKENS